jgi:hypothetical protein
MCLHHGLWAFHPEFALLAACDIFERDWIHKTNIPFGDFSGMDPKVEERYLRSGNNFADSANIVFVV